MAGAEAFFLGVQQGQRYCLYHPAQGPCRAALVYLHPLAEEMNRSRRMAALQARALAALGVAVLQIDLLGCGDSSGDFGDASWQAWRDDVDAACGWLRERTGTQPGLWGLRVGALLALDYAASAQRAPARLVLWQVPATGAACLSQFLRLRLAAEMLDGDAAKTGQGTQALRAQLAAGATLEIAGYALAPQLALPLEAINPAALAFHGGPVDCFDTGAGDTLSPAAERLAAQWRAQQVDLRMHCAPGVPFWATQEVGVSEALLAATSALFGGTAHVH